MAINISSNIFPLNNGPAIWTHEDIYGKGGFVAIITTTDLPLINDHITPARRKEGMLVYDVATEKYYRCLSAATDTNDANWTEENFGGSTVAIQQGTGISVNVTEESIYTISLNASLNNLDQDEDGAFNESQIILTVPINVPPYSLISYSSTGDILDRHRIFLHSKSIQGFNIYITNEHGVIIPNLTDYNISMSFFSEETEVNQSFKMVEILNDIFILIGKFIQELKAKFFI